MQEHDARLLRARLSDFFDRRTPWQRALWHIGTPLGLREVVEYGEYVRSGAHPDRTGLKYVSENMVGRIELDAGIAESVKAELAPLLRGKPEETLTALAISELSARIANGYIDRWVDALSSPTPPGVELAARSVAAHLLDAGYSSDFLYRWLTDAPGETPEDLKQRLSEAEVLAKAKPRTFEVLVPCPALPRLQALTAALSSTDAAAWRDAKCPDAPAVPETRAIVFKVDALEPYGAVERAAASMARVVARTAVATEKHVRASGKAWVEGEANTFDLNTGRKTVRVPMLRAHVLSLGATDSSAAAQLDDALELMSSMAHGTDGAAITNGWAAIEGLMTEPGERSRYLAADRMALIVACSFVRAELTYLAWSHREHGADDLAKQLEAAEKSSNESLRLIEGALDEGAVISCGSPSDEAALARVHQLRQAPKDVLTRVAGYVTEALRRLYTQRNQVMHSGSFRSETILPTLRTTPLLVGAGVDRVAAAHLLSKGQLSPLGLSVRADVELRLVGSPASAPLGRLLG